MANNAFEKFFKEQSMNNNIESEVKPGEKRILGKIIKVQLDKPGDEGEENEVESGGWGFISSREIPYTRIFFHWTSLKQDTLRFPDLRNGMKVEFTPVEVEGKGLRAIKIRVIEP